MLSSGAALGNGRFPRAERLIEHRSDPNKLLLAATYGLLITQDRGQNWQLICESSYAFVSGQETDPIADLGADGSILASIFESLNRSAEPGCNFTAVLGGQQKQSVADFSLERANPSRGGAALPSGADGGFSTQLYESSDNGASWKPCAPPLPANQIRAVHTLDIAPSNPQRLYVTGIDAQNHAKLLRSDDRGGTFNAYDIPTDSSAGEYAYIAAVHPTNPDILYVRTDLWAPNADGLDEGADRLLYSSNGGQTWTEIYQAAAKLFGFALSPDGATVLIGYGDPVDGGGRVVNPDVTGIYRSATTGGVFNFTQTYAGSVTCLTWTARGVYVCTSQDEKKFALGFAAQPDFTLSNANPLTPLLRLQDVRQPLQCPACTSGAACAADWASVCTIFAGCPDGGSGAPGTGGAQDCDGSAGSSGGTSAGGAVGSGTGGSGASVGGRDGGGGPKLRELSDDSSCGCRIPRSESAASDFALLLSGLVALYWRSARRRADRRE